MDEKSTCKYKGCPVLSTRPSTDPRRKNIDRKPYTPPARPPSAGAYDGWNTGRTPVYRTCGSCACPSLAGPVQSQRNIVGTAGYICVFDSSINCNIQQGAFLYICITAVYSSKSHSIKVKIFSSKSCAAKKHDNLRTPLAWRPPSDVGVLSLHLSLKKTLLCLFSVHLYQRISLLLQGVEWG